MRRGRTTRLLGFRTMTNKGELILQATSYGTAQRMFVASTPWSAEQFQRICGFGEETNIVREIYGKPDSAEDPYLSELFDTASLVECKAVNASYTVHFDYINGQQNLTINIDKSYNPLIPIYNVTGPAPTASNPSTHQSSEAADPTCSTWNAHKSRCTFSATTLRTLSYQSITDAFSTILHGTLTTSNPSVQHLLFPHSDVPKTRLTSTNDLAWIPAYFHYLTPHTINLTAQLELQAGTQYVGLSNTKSTSTPLQGSLATAIEDLFANYTISLMSDPYLLPNYTSPRAPQRFHAVTLEADHNVYEYDSATLWIAYGVAIGVATLITVVGLVVMWLNGVAYDGRFSTVLRVSREASLEVKDGGGAVGLGEDEVDDGRQALSRELGEGVVRMRCGRGRGRRLG